MRSSIPHNLGIALAGLFAFALLVTAVPAQPGYVGPTFIDTIAGFGTTIAARTGDIDADGDVDAVYIKAGTIVTLLNDGSGNFTEVMSPGPSGGVQFRLGSLNGGGDLDLVAVTNTTLSTWIHTGGGSFGSGQSIGIPSGLARNPALLNLNPNSDNDLDVAVIESTGTAGRIRLYTNNGAGTLSFSSTTGFLSGFNGSQVHAADMDGDGDRDLVAVYQGGFMVNDRLYVYFNNGLGGFPSNFLMQLTATSYLGAIVLEDVTGDSRPDVVSNSSTAAVTYVNSGTGTISSTVSSGFGLTSISGLDVADIDGDGNQDAFITQSTAPYGSEFLKGDGAGGFVPFAIPLTGTNPNPCCPSLADLNGDTVPDAIFTVLGGANASIGKILFGVEAVDFRKVMITEACSGSPDHVEITNFGLGSVDLTGWSLQWKDGSTSTSNTLSITLAPGEPAIISEPIGGQSLPVAPAIQVVEAWPFNIGTTSSDFAVALRDPSGTVVDEVRVSSTSGSYAEGSLGGYFRGVALRSGSGNSSSVERIWGLDSNSGADWSEAILFSPGYENTTSGQRGTDTLAVTKILINETDDSPDLIELFNPNAFPVDVSGWTLWCSAIQNGNHTIVTPFDAAYVMAPGEYLVIGESASPPSEMPGGTTYIDVAQNIPWTTSEYDCALYDAYGRCIDVMRTTGNDDEVVHNHPRAPAAWDDFTGAAGRLDGGGDDAVGRRFSSDSNRGDDFEPVFTRTMGSANLSTTFAAFNRGLDSELDVRFNSHALGGGHSMIINAGPANAGMKYSYLVSISHSGGTGPFLGLPLDAISNWFALKDSFPFGANLDANGAHTIHLPPVTSLPAGFPADILGILQDPAGNLLEQTKVIEFDVF